MRWPDGRRFAFTIIDDPDGQDYGVGVEVYALLRDLGFQTSRAVWPVGPRRPTNSGGETCASVPYLQHTLDLQRRGFEIAYHNATPHTSPREETDAALERFRDMFGDYPRTMANHYNEEAIYWGAARVSGVRRFLYNGATLGRRSNRHHGHVEGSPLFWGDLCRERIHYCRNFVFDEVDTLAACPMMPYHDPARPYVAAWYAAAEGAAGPSFMRMISDRNQERLEESGGACILYTHFGHGFHDGGKLEPEFVRLMTRLARANGWFVPVGTLLDHLRAQADGQTYTLTPPERRRLELRWLRQKLLRGTS
jgi:hypothetical protein